VAQAAGESSSIRLLLQRSCAWHATNRCDLCRNPGNSAIQTKVLKSTLNFNRLVPTGVVHHPHDSCNHTPDDMQQKMAQAMQDPAVAERMRQMQEMMKRPEMQQQMAEMQAYMQNQQLQQRMQELRNDPGAHFVLYVLKALSSPT
jgi:hypothetical protein